MADYFPLVARAVAGLDKNTGESRRALYERARAALLNQLRSVEPALGASDITRERLALEDAIRRVEAEAARRTRSETAEGAQSRPSISDQGLRGFRETVADAEALGDAAAEANRSAREVYRAMPGEQAPPAGGNERRTAAQFFEPPTAAPSPVQAPPARQKAPLAETQPTPARAEALPPPPSSWPW